MPIDVEIVDPFSREMIETDGVQCVLRSSDMDHAGRRTAGGLQLIALGPFKGPQHVVDRVTPIELQPDA